MTAADNPSHILAEISVNSGILQRLKKGDASIFEKLNLSFEQIYSSVPETRQIDGTHVNAGDESCPSFPVEMCLPPTTG
ncbi:MAG TPA: hypothetical protein VJA94_07725 [Candidatus Angelobacter sp.]